MPNIDVTIWGRERMLEVDFDDHYGEETLSRQRKTYNQLLVNWENVNNAKCAVEQYIIDNNGDELPGVGVDNIFKYVIPTTIYIPKNEGATVAILCDYRFDPEHGIAIVFEAGAFQRVVVQDEIL